ncbi:MAG: DUF2834 domain-containing protein [Myxococcota bacterium]|nr:DUF2834 domain-containing protein [Myxococcota bacterium]
MSGKQILLWSVFALFLGLTVLTVAEVGYLGFFELAAANWATRLLFVDLAITLSLVAAWMYLDARERGKPFVPYALVTLFFGAAGPLLYLIRRGDGERVRTTT